MSPLKDQQKQLLFDYCIGITTEEQTGEAQALIASNDEAAEIHSKLQAALAPLDTVQPEPCPDDLAERTILRLNNIAHTSQLRLQQLLAGEQARSVAIKTPFWRNIGKIATAAAVFLIALGVFQSSSNFARQRYRQYQCRSQLGGIYRGLSNYMADYDNKLPAVATRAGAPWWKVGDQGPENYSNTRRVWLLIKGGYVDIALFDCPGRPPKVTIRLTPSQIQQLNDFPYREQISYSFRICCPKPAQRVSPSLKALLSDMNPLFEMLPRDYSTQLKRRLDKDLLTRNSINHNRRGQNILFNDGCVKFCRKRCIGITADDPFTLKNILIYNGTEIPDSETDSLLAP